MRVRTRIARPHPKVLAGSVLLITALAGCGGGSSQKPAALGTSVTSTSSAAAPTTSAASATTPSKAPTSSAPGTSAPTTGTGDYAAFPGFKPPADMIDVFDPTPSTGNAVKDKILADNVQALRAMDVWSITGDFNTPGISTYISAALHGAYEERTAQYHAAGKVPAGTARFYDRKVVAVNGNTAQIIDCEDGRHGYDKDVKTGKPIPGSYDGIVAIAITAVKDSAGVWQAVFYNKEKAPALCAAP